MKRVSLLALLTLSVSLVGCMAATEPTDGDEDQSELGVSESIDPEATGAEVVGTATQALSAGNMVICAGGYAPVRYYNLSCANGTIYDYYPQGMHGWAETGGGCSSGGVDWYFHPNNGQHGGWIEAWRLCNY
jgi:hypothetical protein